MPESKKQKYRYVTLCEKLFYHNGSPSKDEKV
jgi:hypothetical protein